jgi:hypothetical protein
MLEANKDDEDASLSRHPNAEAEELKYKSQVNYMTAKPINQGYNKRNSFLNHSRSLNIL